MSTTVGEAISRVRNTLKAVKEDPFLTDRTIYFSIIKYGQSLMKREDNQLRLMKISNIFRTMPYVDLIEVDKVDAACVGVYSGCYFKRTKEKLPDGHLYFPNLAWDAVKIEAIFENDVETCDSDDCLVKQEQSLNIPDYLFSEIEQYVIKELTMTLQVPSDGSDDSQNTLR
mgnify:CR=1 FL=1